MLKIQKARASFIHNRAQKQSQSVCSFYSKIFRRPLIMPGRKHRTANLYSSNFWQGSLNGLLRQMHLVWVSIKRTSDKSFMKQCLQRCRIICRKLDGQVAMAKKQLPFYYIVMVMSN